MIVDVLSLSPGAILSVIVLAAFLLKYLFSKNKLKPEIAKKLKNTIILHSCSLIISCYGIILGINSVVKSFTSNENSLVFFLGGLAIVTVSALAIYEKFKSLFAKDNFKKLS